MKFIPFFVALPLLAGVAFGQNSKPAQQPAPVTSAQPAPARKVKEAKTTAEYDAYKAVETSADPVAAEALANQFLQKYPQSTLKDTVSFLVMRKFRSTGNEDKTLDWGRKALSYDADNIQALLLVSEILSRSTHKTDIDADEKVAELTKSAKHAIELIDAGELLALGASPQQSQGAAALAYSALGHNNTMLEDWTEAEKNLKKATDLQGADADPVTWLDYTITLDHLQKYAEGLAAANKAVMLASSTSGYETIVATAKNEQARLQQLAAVPKALVSH